MSKRGKKMLEVDSCIKAFLKDFRQFAHVGAQDEGAYYWNEREIQWELFRHLRQRAVSHRIGSEWWFHAEGTVEKPAYSRWRSRKRADVVMINHSSFKKWSRLRTGSLPTYELMIEVKVVWSGQGRAATSAKIRADLKKLATCLGGHLTKEAHMILIDGLDVQSTPYYSKAVIQGMLEHVHLRPKLASRLHLWHWPDSERPIAKIKKAHWKHYTGYV